MGNFRDRFKGRSFGSTRPTLHKAICSNCGKECGVPFRPTGEKPVYCRDCFRKIQGGEGNGDTHTATFSKDEFMQLSAKVDKILSLLERAIIQEVPAPLKKKQAAK